MSQTYMTRRRADNQRNAAPVQTAAPGPSLDALKGGAMPSQEQLGHRVDLPGAIREKMETSFGMDFSGVQLYESQTVADAGAEAMTMGDKIGFAPGQLDLASTAGQAVLGHELSHVVSQARGEASGRGFLADQALEARADREGARAAAGESVYSGPVAPLSAGSTALSAAGPMQAKKKEDEEAPAPAPAVPEETQRVAAASWQAVKDDSSAKSDAYNAALDEYNAKRGPGERAYDPQAKNIQMDNGYNPNIAIFRFLSRNVGKRGKEEQQQMLADFHSGDMERMRPYFQSEIERISGMDTEEIDEMLPESDKDVAAQYEKLGKMSSDIHGLSDLTSHGFITPESMGYDPNDEAAMDQFSRYQSNMSRLLRHSLNAASATSALSRGLNETAGGQSLDELRAARSSMGRKTSSEMLSYRSAAVGEQAQQPLTDFDPTDSSVDDVIIRRLYDEIKANPNAPDISEKRQRFARYRAAQMESRYGRH